MDVKFGFDNELYVGVQGIQKKGKKLQQKRQSLGQQNFLFKLRVGDP